jgi:hypothetical protein
MGIGRQQQLGAVLVSGAGYILITAIENPAVNRQSVMKLSFLPVSLTLSKLAAGLTHEPSGCAVVLGLLCLAYFPFGLPH